VQSDADSQSGTRAEAGWAGGQGHSGARPVVLAGWAIPCRVGRETRGWICPAPHPIARLRMA